jgi:hypothetical protein
MRLVVHADFSQARFLAMCNFSGSHFSAGFTAYQTDFVGAPHFKNCVAGTQASFVEAKFRRVADFVDTRFDCETWWGDAHFFAEAFFRGSRFSGSAQFMGTTFDSDVDLRAATIDGQMQTRGLKFPTSDTDGVVDFQHVNLGPDADLKFEGTDLSRTSLYGTDLTRIKFNGCTWARIPRWPTPIRWISRSSASRAGLFDELALANEPTYVRIGLRTPNQVGDLYRRFGSPWNPTSRKLRREIFSQVKWTWIGKIRQPAARGG